MKEFLVEEGKNIKISDFATTYKTPWSKEETMAKTAENIEAVNGLQEKLYAEGQQSLLIVLQAMDAGGKDGTIRKVFGPLNPQGCQVSSFKAPSPLEKSHDYLWRIHSQAPERGMIRIFNRSHYEEVLIVRVHNWISEETCRARYKQIRSFENLLADNKTRVIKFFLNISKEEQKARFQERLDNPDKWWKFAQGDLEERKHWDLYMKQFGEVLSFTSTKENPWYVVPADRKSSRDWIISSVVRRTLEDMNPQYPKTTLNPREIRIED